MTINYIHVSANGRLSDEDFAIIQRRLKLAECAILNIPAFGDLSNIDVFVQAEDLPSYRPVDGFASNSHRVEIYVDPNQDEFYKNPEKDNLFKVLAHEFHHVLRMRSIEPKNDLGYALVFEGLAICFESEMGHRTIDNKTNLSKSELLEVSDRARHFILGGRRDYIHSHWFFGTENDPNAKEHFKRGAGYSLGFAIVCSWLNNSEVNGGHDTASKAACLPVEAILKPWLEKGNEFLAPWLEKVTRPHSDRRTGSKNDPSLN